MEDMTKSNFSRSSFVEFPSIKNQPIDEMPYDRVYMRTNVTQPTYVEGENRSIILNDGNNDRILIGYQKNGF